MEIGNLSFPYKSLRSFPDYFAIGTATHGESGLNSKLGKSVAQNSPSLLTTPKLGMAIQLASDKLLFLECGT